MLPLAAHNSIAPFIIIPVMIIVAIVFSILGYQAQQKRRAEMAALAQELGCSFEPANDRAFDDMYSRFDIFQKGHSRTAYNTISGRHEVAGRPFPLRMGDFLYKITTSNGKTTTTHTHRLSYLILHLPFATPDLLIRREGVMDKLAGALGFDDIDFESSEFSKKFFVKCPDKKFAFGVVHPRMMEFLLAAAAGGQAPPIMIYGGCCLLTDGTRTWPAADFRARLAFLDEFFTLWPDYLTA